MKVLVTARAFWVSGQASQARMEAEGCEVIHSSRAGPLTEDDLIAQLQGCEAVIASSDPYTARVFDSCPALQLVARCGVGIDSVEMDAATRFGVVVTSTPGAMTEAVADYAFGLLLAVARRIPEGDALMRAGGWSEFPGPLVYGKTLGLVGYGRIGRAVARRAAGFGMRVLAFDPYGASSDGPNEPPVTFTDLDELLSASDFVSIHAPNSPETREMINAERLARMKPTAYLINTARGPLIDEGALLAALEEGRIAGAALDVFQQEPLPPDHPLRRQPRCLLTPHNAFNAFEAAEEMSMRSAESVLSLLRREKPADMCNPAVWSSTALRWS